MSLFENPDSILMLKKLLEPSGKEDSSSDSEDEIKKEVYGPSDIGPKVSNRKPNKLQPKPEKNTTIEEWLKNQEKEDTDILETRKRPEYTLSYKQVVGTEDLFLQMGNKTSASSSCEDMVIDVQVPEETVDVQEMDISVTEAEIDLTTPVYRLKLPLTQPIDPDRSSAKYFTERKVLRLTCRMKREYDFVNF